MRNTTSPAAESAPLLPGPTSVTVRNVSLTILAVLAVIALLRLADSVFIPVVVAVLLSYALSPMVTWLQRRHVPRVIGASLVLVAIVGALGGLIYTLRDDARALLEELPAAAAKLQKSLHTANKNGESTIEKVKDAASELEKAAATAAGAPKTPKDVTRVQVVEQKFKMQDFLLAGSVGVMGAIWQITAVFFLVFFLLVAGDLYKRKLVHIAGPSLADKRVTVQILDDINSQIERFLFIQLVSGIIVGVATWLALSWLGLENAAVWGFAAGVLNSLPYVGPIAITAGTALVAFMQFGTLSMALTISGVTLLITSVEGFLLLPWLTSKAGRMNAVAVFIALLFWGWLWGAWGLLLAVPIMMICKAVCDRVENLRPLGELLGN